MMIHAMGRRSVVEGTGPQKMSIKNYNNDSNGHVASSTVNPIITDIEN